MDMCIISEIRIYKKIVRYVIFLLWNHPTPRDFWYDPRTRP